jgi:hypothetical protein
MEQLAIEKDIPIDPPHQGIFLEANSAPVLTILGPDKAFYLSLIQASDKTPSMNVLEGLAKAFAEVAEGPLIHETMDFATEHLTEQDETTSSENDMSLIMLLQWAGKKILFTADAGTMGRNKAIRYARGLSVDLKDLFFSRYLIMAAGIISLGLSLIRFMLR